MSWLLDFKRRFTLFLPSIVSLLLDHPNHFYNLSLSLTKKSEWNLSIEEAWFNRKGRMLEPILFEPLFQYSRLSNRNIECGNKYNELITPQAMWSWQESFVEWSSFGFPIIIIRIMKWRCDEITTLTLDNRLKIADIFQIMFHLIG